MDAFKTGLITVVIGVAIVSLPLTPGWKLAGGILTLGLGATALIQALRPSTTE